MVGDRSLTPVQDKPELLAPAGNWDCAQAAVENGADAIYFGLDQFNARMRAQNFTEADLPELMAFLHLRGVKGYVTLNTLIFPQELPQVERYLKTLITAGVDAVIVQDIGLCRLIRHLSPDFPIHASTQMTITSTQGVKFAQDLGASLVVLARECSLAEIEKIQQQLHQSNVSLPLEVFVHGALCVAYSGQCLTSEALGGRSANRGECAQACRMPYDLIVDGKTLDLGDRKYLLSPQDLAGLAVLPELIKTGVSSLKIEGRLKSPEYVANVTRVYREALTKAIVSFQQTQTYRVTVQEQYNLEMAFSRGLYTGWFAGINNQALVHAQFGKKRGVYLGEVLKIKGEQVSVKLQAPVKPGDGIVFDHGHPERQEEGGRVYSVDLRKNEAWLSFGRGDVNLKRVKIGDRLWKTSDPELDKQLRQTYRQETPQFQRPITLEIYGELNQPLTAIARDELGHIIAVTSDILLTVAHSQPLTVERLKTQWGRLGNTPFYLDELTSYLQGDLMLPVSELNRLRRELVSRLELARKQPLTWTLNPTASFKDLLPRYPQSSLNLEPELIVLVRNLEQVQTVLDWGVKLLYCEFEDPKKYRQAVDLVKKTSLNSTIFVAPPRITKPGENWILQQVKNSQADGYLIRNYDQLVYFQEQRCVGDFSLNIANALTADYLKTQFNLERLTASYDLNIQQLADLLATCPPEWLEITIHQRVPMFHMEHCVFCAFLSSGTDYTNCGRPCEQYEVKLRDRTGTEHFLKADVGCRNTVYNGTAQTGAEYLQKLIELGARYFRIEFMNETPQQVKSTLQCYQKLLQGELTGAQLWQELKLQNQLGVTRGTLESDKLAKT